MYLLRTFFLVAMVTLSGLLNLYSASAQDTSANIYGTATDAKGGLIPGVKVTALNDGLGIQREAVTNSEGHYMIPLLPAGKYTITAEMPGFATLRITNVNLAVSINSNVPIMLSPKEIAETVSVEAEANKIDTSSATIKHSITNEQVRGLPILTGSSGRGPLSVLPFLVPGVTPTSGGASLGRGNRLGESMSINGNRTISISYNFEGGDNNDSGTGTAASPFPNPDALQEFTVITNNYQADVGRSSGGVVNAISRSGTDSFHGNFRYYHINESLNARSFFDGAIPLNRLGTFGGQVGGPVFLPRFGEGGPRIWNGSNRTHFFFDYERTRTSLAETSFINLLSEQERIGDFSNLPAAQRPRDPLTGQPFPGGRIPANRINPISQIYLDRFIPRASDGLRTLRQVLQTDLSSVQHTTRIDHKISSRDNLRGTFFYTKSNQTLDFGDIPMGTTNVTNNTTSNIVLNETHVFSPRTVNQFIVAGTYIVLDGRAILGSGASGIAPADIGITGVRPQTNSFLSVPGITVSGTGVFIPGNIVPAIRAKTTWQVKDDLSHTWDVHTLKFGGEVRSFLFNSTLGNNNGTFTFASTNTSGTRNSIADFLLGMPSAYSQTTGNVMYPRQRAYDFYFMDDWKPRASLTINLGVRYELTKPMVDLLNQVSVYRPGQKSQRFPNAPAGLLFAGDPDPILGTVPRAGYPTDKNNFAPRLGIAYSPAPRKGLLRALFGDQKTAIRAGWGIFFDQSWGGNVTRFQSVQPFSVSQVLTTSQINSAGGNFANPFGTLPNSWPLDLTRRAFVGTPVVSAYDPNYRTAYTYQYNFSVQRELPQSLLLELAYVGSNTFKADRERELNLGIVRPGATIANLQSRRINPAFGSVGNHESTGRARYDSFQSRLSRRFTRGLAIDASYVFRKALDNGSSPQGIGNTFTSGAAGSRSFPDQWARSTFDSRHNFVVSYTYELPNVGRAKVPSLLLHGWQLGGIVQYRTGGPMEIVQLEESTLTGRTRQGNPDFVGPYRRLDPREVRTFVIQGVPTPGHYFFDPNAFAPVGVSDWTGARPGTLGRNVFDAPGLQSWALSVVKRTRLRESHEIEFRADINNLFNHANFSGIGTFVDFEEFGQALGASAGRVIQLSARYSF